MTPEQEAYLLQQVEDFILYLKNDLIWDLKYILYAYLGPLLISVLALQGFLSILRAIYKLIFPPDAAELHRTALAALHHHKRRRRDDQFHAQEAEQILLKAIARDDQYAPAYLSLVALYIYRIKSPDKALEILDMALDRLSTINGSGSITSELEALRLDAKALKEGGNENMIVAGGSLFAENEYLSAIPSKKIWTIKETQTQQAKPQQAKPPKKRLSATKDKLS